MRADIVPRRATADCWYDFIGQLVTVRLASGRVFSAAVRSDAMARRMWWLHCRRGWALLVVGGAA